MERRLHKVHNVAVNYIEIILNMTCNWIVGDEKYIESGI